MKPIEQRFRKLLGQMCWGVHFSRLLNLSMNFGKPRLRVREPYRASAKSDAVRRIAAGRLVAPKGPWWLWIYLAHWKLCTWGQKVRSGSSPLRRIDAALRHLEGQKLVAAAVDERSGATRLAFDLGGVLHVRRRARNADELWMLYEPSGYVLSVHGDGSWSHEPGSGTDARPRVIKRPLPSP